MTGSGGHAEAGAAVDPPHWAVRVERSPGDWGSGVLLAENRIVTCEHVVTGADTVNVVHHRVGAGPVTVPAGVERRVPERVEAGERMGDVAVLRLHGPLPGAVPATLHDLGRNALNGRTVALFGHPRDSAAGWRLTARVESRLGRDGRVQLSPAGDARLASGGFSGGGVVDDAGRVIGLVVGRHAELGGSVMIPAEAVLGQLGMDRAPFRSGQRAVQVTAAEADGPLPDEDFAERFTAWLNGESWRVLVEHAQEGSSRELTLRRLLGGAATPDPAGRRTSEPPRPDLAVSAKDHDVSAIEQRIAERMGLDDTSTGVGDAAVVVLDAEAADQEQLFALVAALGESGGRFLLGYGNNSAHGWHRADERLVREPFRARWAALVGQAERYPQAWADTVGVHTEQVFPAPRALAARVDRSTGALSRSAMLIAYHRRLTGENLEDPSRHRELLALEKAMAHRYRRLKQLDGALGALVAERELLAADFDRARRAALRRTLLPAEAEEAERLGRAAQEALDEQPGSVPRIRAAVAAYCRFTAGGPDGAGPDGPGSWGRR